MRNLQLPNDMDSECVRFCDAINSMKGLCTTSSCCGHNKEPFRIWFRASYLGALLPLLYCLDSCHSNIGGWKVTATTDCSMSHVTFCIESTWSQGGKAYRETEELASLLTKNDDARR